MDSILMGWRLIGSLLDDSRGLYVRLQNVFDAPSLETLNAIYAEVFQLGGTEESDVLRTDGASFNPKPARVAQILIDDLEVRDFSAIGAGLCSPLSHTSRFRMKAATVQMLELCEQARLLFEEEVEECPLEVRLLGGAIALDDVRHLHMRDVSSPRKRELVDQVSKAVLGNLLVPEAATIRVKLDTAIAMQRRRLK